MKFKSLLCIAGLCMAPAIALAQWGWTDAQGRKIYSDQPPPVEVPERNILRRPSGSAAPAAAPAANPADAVTAAGTPAPGAAPKPTGVDKELQERARQAEEAEKAKRAAEEQRIAKARAENCSRARQGKATFDSGMRVARTNAKGEREIMDDQARADEQRRLQTIIDADCK